MKLALDPEHVAFHRRGQYFVTSRFVFDCRNKLNEIKANAN